MAERILISDLFRNTGLLVTNRLRLLRPRKMDYAVLALSGSFPERALQPRRPFPLSLLPWPPPATSVEFFAETLERLALDPRVQGAILIVSGLQAGPATLGSLRKAIARFRKSGKRAIAYLHDLGFWSYYLACACDEIVAPESASFRSAGLWSESIFLKDTLALVGIEADFEAIAEYKVAPDIFRRTEMTEPHREMLESLLDSLYSEVTGAIAQGRGLAPERVTELLDAVPLTAQQALDGGLLDGLCYEDELPARLGTATRPSQLQSWDQVRRHLVRPRRWRSRRSIGVISLEGTIVPGPSRQPPLPIPLPLPLPAVQAGSGTLAQQLRSAAQSKELAAVVLYVDSPGGSSQASDLIWREVTHLSRIKPVVVYMGNQAASGGYYVSAGANAIVAQPATLTGSIGIWGGKLVTRDLYAKVRAGRGAVWRGQAAGLYADSSPFSDEERSRIRADLGHVYLQFKARVAEGRHKSEDEVEAIARGRVWSGEQALALGLVDELGDLETAAARARALAGLDPRRYVRVVNVPVPKRYQLPQPAAAAADWLAGLSSLVSEGALALAPWTIRIRG